MKLPRRQFLHLAGGAAALSAPRSCDLRSITPLSQKCAYQRQPASEEPRVLRSPGLTPTKRN